MKTIKHTVTREYQKGWFGKKLREKEEPKLLAEGYVIESEEEIKSGNFLASCMVIFLLLGLTIVFFPAVILLLAFILGGAKEIKTKVTYVKHANN